MASRKTDSRKKGRNGRRKPIAKKTIKTKARRMPQMPTPKLPPKMIDRPRWGRISWRAIENAFIFQQDATLADIAKLFGVEYDYVCKKSAEGNWQVKKEVQWKKIAVKLQEKYSDKIAEVIAQSQTIADGAIGKLVEYLKADRLIASMSDLREFLKLRLQLYQIKGQANEADEYEKFIRQVDAIREKALRDNAGIIDAEVSQIEAPATNAPPAGQETKPAEQAGAGEAKK